jgi:DedD protein
LLTLAWEFHLSTPFQNRLVGTIIVAAVAIIVLPDLLDGNKKNYQDEFDAIPPAPKVDFVKTPHNFPQDKLVTPKKEVLSNEQAVDDALTKVQSKNKIAGGNGKVKVSGLNKETAITKQRSKKASSESSSKTHPPEKSVLKQAWVIQLGSFRHKKNVAQLLLKLKDNGYTAFTKPIKTKNGTLIKVFIGPELIKSSLAKKIPALKKLTNVQGKVARFTPTK